MFTTTLRGMLTRKRRLFATTTAVVLGVAFLVATLVVGDTMRAGFARGFERVYAGVDVGVRSSVVIGSDPEVRGVVDGAVVEQIAGLPGVESVVPVVQGVGTILAADGDRIGGGGPPTVATGWITDPAVNPYVLAEGRAPTGPGEVVIDRAAAESGDLAVGSTTRVLVPQPVEVTVVGIATFGDDDSFGPSTFVAFADATARDLLAVRPGAVSEVLVVAEDGVSPTTLRDEIMTKVPARIEALAQPQLIADAEAEVESDFVAIFERLLLAFAGIALVVATFSIHNTFSIVVAQRTRESALMRAIGASRRQVLLSVTLEALVVGLVASAIGLGVGVLLALGLDALLAAAGLSLGGSLAIASDTIVVGVIVGVVTTLVASIAPALRASRVAPLAALRDVAVDRSATSIVRAGAGIVLTGLGGLGVVTASGDGAMVRASLSSLAVIVGTVVLGPIVARPTAAVLGGTVAGVRGFTGTLARRNAMRNPRRVAGSASALMVGTAVVALFATFGSSIKESVDQEVDQAFSGDLVILQDDFSGAGITPDLAPALAELPEVDDAVGVAFATARIDGEDQYPAATDPAALAAAFDLGVTDGDLASMTAGQIAVSTEYAEDHGLGVGDHLTLEFVDGSLDVEIAATYERALSFGSLVMTTTDWAPHAGRTGDTVLFATLAEGVPLTTGQTAVNAVTDRFGAPDAQTRDEYIDQVAAEVDQMLMLVYGLLAVAVLIALLGIGNTLSLSIHERTRELGLLRAVGQTRAQVRATVRWESVIVAVFGTIGGVGIGTFLGWGLMRALRAQEGIGAFAAPWAVLAVVLILAATAGVLAAIRPARRAGRLDVLAAIASE